MANYPRSFLAETGTDTPSSAHNVARTVSFAPLSVSLRCFYTLPTVLYKYQRRYPGTFEIISFTPHSDFSKAYDTV